MVAVFASISAVMRFSGDVSNLCVSTKQLRKTKKPKLENSINKIQSAYTYGKFYVEYHKSTATVYHKFKLELFSSTPPTKLNMWPTKHNQAVLLQKK